MSREEVRLMIIKSSSPSSANIILLDLVGGVVLPLMMRELGVRSSGDGSSELGVILAEVNF